MPLSSLGLTPVLHDAAVRAHALQTPSPIQALAIPQLLGGADAVVRAPTGSGKTLAYGLVVLQHLLGTHPSPTRQTRALVLVPTRELAQQVAQSLRSVAQQLPVALRVHAVYGGVSINPQMLALRGGTDLLIATPGRLLDLIAHHAVNLAQVACLVLDEADRLLALGFAQELQEVLRQMPQRRQNLFISATMPPAAQALADQLLNAPLHIDSGPGLSDAPDILQRAIQVDTSRRTQLLRHLVTTEKWPRVLVFVATKLASEMVADKLRKAGLTAEPFHGELSQGKRNQVLADFKAERLGVVVATDVAARGLDIIELPVVVNYDLPRSTADYTHRIGRTGRAGARGLAVSFVCADSAAHFQLIAKRHALDVLVETVPGFEPTETAQAAPAPVDTSGNGGIKGKRPSKKDRLRAQAGAATAANDHTADETAAPVKD